MITLDKDKLKKLKENFDIVNIDVDNIEDVLIYLKNSLKTVKNFQQGQDRFSGEVMLIEIMENLTDCINIK